MRSRVSGAFQAINYGTRPAGALLGGLLGTALGLRPALWIAVAGGVAGALLLLPSPLPGFRMPTGLPETAPASSRTPNPSEARDPSMSRRGGRRGASYPAGWGCGRPNRSGPPGAEWARAGGNGAGLIGNVPAGSGRPCTGALVR